MQKLLLVAFSAAFLSIASPVQADVQITSRSSLLWTTIDFGYVGSVTTTTDSLAYTNIDDTQITTAGSLTDGGPLGDVSWDATYQYSLDQHLDPVSAQGISGAGGVGLFTSVGGDGVSYLSSSNRLELDFENSALADFFLRFVATPDSRVDLGRLVSPGNWENVYTNGGFGETTTTLPLEAGTYRLMAQTDTNTQNGFANGGSWSFEFSAVPEPSSLMLMAIGAAGLFMRRRFYTSP
ncbi:MAG: PEP-CTERM sorting domain-containing protein [Planctomycetia bacterium]|nr:PEP-CTERM sorting domain-containing protein [Planctomycetia bacterium]